MQSLQQYLERLKDPYYSYEISLRAEAYGLAVLARAGKADIAAQRLLFDQLVDQDGEVFAKSLAVAADAAGDRSDRDSLLKSLTKAPNQSEEPELEDYGTLLRDQLAALAAG